jgi:hypothetical protein
MEDGLEANRDHHTDGHGLAPALALSSLQAVKASLKATAFPTREHDDVTSVYKCMSLESDRDEHTVLQALYTAHAGDFVALAAAVQSEHPQYYLDPAKLIVRAPTTAKQFAWQCVEGYYLGDPVAMAAAAAAAPAAAT